MRQLTNILSWRRPPLILATTGVVSLAFLLARPSVVQAANGVEEEALFVFNTFSFLIFGALVMWMCAGFTMLEAGSVRTKNASMICLKNIGLYSIAGLAYFFIGYNLMYADVGGFIGSFSLLYGPSADEIALVGGQESAAAAVLQAESKYSTMSDWFFQMVFVATAASIVSGALAERVKMWSFFLFTLVLTALIYPIVGAWTWGGGWLNSMGFQDFAGSTIVHGTGGWAALAGILVVGPRLGKFHKDGTARITPPSNIVAVTLGVFILWFGWFGFNGGSQLALGSAADAVAMSHVLVNTNLAAAAGVVTAIAVSRFVLGRIDLFAALNGAIAGLVSITAAPDIVEHYWAIVIGAIGGSRMHDWTQTPREGTTRRCRRRCARPPFRWHLGNTCSMHRRGWQLRSATARCGCRGSICLHNFLAALASAGKDHKCPRIATGGTSRSGCGGTWDRSLPRVCVDARGVP